LAGVDAPCRCVAGGAGACGIGFARRFGDDLVRKQFARNKCSTAVGRGALWQCRSADADTYTSPAFDDEVAHGRVVSDEDFVTR